MKFSVLLPTRNRLEYLKYAIDSVRKQDYNDWEIIISDNASEENIQGYIASLNDDRIKYSRTNDFCSVTENWNNTIEKSSGDYVIMLGDDDCLLDGYFSYCNSLLQQHQFPDMIYCSAFIYTYPGVLPQVPQGNLVQYGFAPFLLQQQQPSILDQSNILPLVSKILNFNLAVNFNMQHTLVAKGLIREMQKYGKFYQSPYPDYYATTALLLKAKRILTVPQPLVVIGICPKSFGYFYFNDKEKQGVKFLQTIEPKYISDRVSKYILAGTNMNISWLMAMDRVFQNFGKEYKLKVSYMKFRFLQILHTCKKYGCREEIDLRDMVKYMKDLFLWEYLPYLFLFSFSFLMRLMPQSQKKKALANKIVYFFSHPDYGILQHITTPFANISEVFRDMKIQSASKD